MVNQDFVALLGKPDVGVGFRQGTIVTWNTSTGENTISVAGGTLTNVPILNTGEAIALQAGHTVGLLTFNGSWFILGRITVPGDSDFASASVAFGGAGATATNFGITTSAASLVSDTITVPDWADEAIVLATGNCQLTNTTASIDFATIQVKIDGTGGGGSQVGASPLGDASGNYVVSMAVSAQRLITSPGSTITVETFLNSQTASWAVQASNRANIDAIAVFRSTV